MVIKEPLTWKCHICGEERPDAKISVLTKPLVINGKVCGNQNIRYCNDKAECIEGAQQKDFFGGENKTTENPLVAITLWFKDGAGLRQVFTEPVPQAKAMAGLGHIVADLGVELKVDLENGWQKEWPDKAGAWWFYGAMKRENQRALFVVIIHATKNEPPVYIAAWQQEIMQPGEIIGWFRWIPTPEMPDGSKVEVW